MGTHSKNENPTFRNNCVLLDWRNQECLNSHMLLSNNCILLNKHKLINLIGYMTLTSYMQKTDPFLKNWPHNKKSRDISHKFLPWTLLQKATKSTTGSDYVHELACTWNFMFRTTLQSEYFFNPKLLHTC